MHQRLLRLIGANHRETVSVVEENTENIINGGNITETATEQDILQITDFEGIMDPREDQSVSEKRGGFQTILLVVLILVFFKVCICLCYGTYKLIKKIRNCCKRKEDPGPNNRTVIHTTVESY
ncbi:hypothetical protein B5X24_HaOG206498 [Helicoverpa armigera]|uniref:Uncharacterized protein n=1 Tax=Helicoverpa armigera TaxID=29058 RepID=A0A2W1BRK1_HELAM|nr:hypothetical protein B5X24_HaOG206498 [Helicoverpa armigera]